VPTQYIQIGPVFDMVQNTIYAIPGRRCLLFTDGVAAAIQQSTDVGFTANVVATLVIGQAEVAGGFVRCTSGNVRATLKVA
jgi:hypothetical protein